MAGKQMLFTGQTSETQSVKKTSQFRKERGRRKGIIKGGVHSAMFDSHWSWVRLHMVIIARKFRIQYPGAIYHERGIRHSGGHGSGPTTFRKGDGKGPF
jgi:hypothetical protein